MADMGKVAPRGCSASSTTSMWFDRRHQQVSLRHHTQCCCESSTCVHFLLCLICAVAAARLLQEVPSTFSKIRVLFLRCAGALLCPHCCNRCWKVLQSCWPFRQWPCHAAAARPHPCAAGARGPKSVRYRRSGTGWPRMGLTASPGFEADLGVVGGCADGDAVYADSIRRWRWPPEPPLNHH